MDSKLASLFKRFNHWLISASFFCCCLILSGFGVMSSSNVVVVSGLTQDEANEILVLLDSYSITAEKKEVAASGTNKGTTWSLSVNSSRKMESLSILNMHGRPRKKTSSTLLSLFNKQGLVSSELEEKIRYQAGLADQISSTLRKLEGILDADVQLSIPSEDNILGTNESKKVTASVYIKHQGVLDDPNSHLEIKIKRLIANSIPDLETENVTVIGDRAVTNTEGLEDRIELVSIWSIHIEKSSVVRFRIILIIMITLITLLTLLTLFCGFKLHKFFMSKEGLHQLLTLSPMEPKHEEHDIEPITQTKPVASSPPVDSTPFPEAPGSNKKHPKQEQPPRPTNKPTR